MTCDSVPPPPPWHAAAAGAPEQLLLDAPARERRRRRALLANEDEEEQADVVNHGVAAGHALAPTAEGPNEETTNGPATALLLLPSEVVGSFSKEASAAPATLLLPLERARLQPLCVASQTHKERSQVVSPTDNSSEHLRSYVVQDPMSARLLAEKTREIWKVSYTDGMEECVEEKISVLTKRLHCNSGDEVLQDCVRGKNGSMSCLNTLLHSGANTKGHNLRKHGPILMTAVQDMCFDMNSASMVPCDSKLQKNQVLKKDSCDRLLDNESDDSKESICRMSVVRAGNRAATDNAVLPLLSKPKCGPLPEPSSFGLIKLQSDQQSPRSSHTAHINLASAQDIDRQQLAACSKCNAQIQENDECSRGDTERQMVDASGNTSQKVPIFIRHCSGQVVLTVKLDEPSQHMIHLFEKKTKMKLLYHYFKYGNSIIEPNCTLLSYGVGRNAIVDACSRLLGGRYTLEEYFHDKINDILMEVTLPDGKVSLEMTVEGCRIMSTWLGCFIWAFSQGMSWGGSFSLKDDFYVQDGHVRITGNNKGLNKGHGLGAIGKDIETLVNYVKEKLCRYKSNLVSEYPPFLKSLTTFLDNRKTVTTISESEKLFIGTHISCTTSSSWGMLLYKLHRRYLGLNDDEKTKWDDAIKSAVLPHGWHSSLPEMTVFKEKFEEAKKDGRNYGTTNIGAFTLMRDTVVHGLDDLIDGKTEKKKYQHADKLALMIPAHMLDFLPNIIENLINKNIDISAELFAAKILCSCQTCAPSF